MKGLRSTSPFAKFKVAENVNFKTEQKQLQKKKKITLIVYLHSKYNTGDLQLKTVTRLIFMSLS